MSRVQAWKLLFLSLCAISVALASQPVFAIDLYRANAICNGYHEQYTACIGANEVLINGKPNKLPCLKDGYCSQSDDATEKTVVRGKCFWDPKPSPGRGKCGLTEEKQPDGTWQYAKQPELLPDGTPLSTENTSDEPHPLRFNFGANFSPSFSGLPDSDSMSLGDPWQTGEGPVQSLPGSPGRPEYLETLWHLNEPVQVETSNYDDTVTSRAPADNIERLPSGERLNGQSGVSEIAKTSTSRDQPYADSTFTDKVLPTSEPSWLEQKLNSFSAGVQKEFSTICWDSFSCWGDSMRNLARCRSELCELSARN